MVIWNLLANGEVFKELGSDYYDQRNEDRPKSRAVKELARLEYGVQPGLAAWRPCSLMTWKSRTLEALSFTLLRLEFYP